MYNPYTVLGLDNSSSVEQAKKAFHRLAKEYHPDHNPNNAKAVDKFRQVKEAYDLICNGWTESLAPPKHYTQPNDQKTITRHLLWTTNISSSYVGGKVVINEQEFKLLAGFNTNSCFNITLANGTPVKINVAFHDLEGYTVEGFDLYTTMTVTRKDLKAKTRLEVPNHPRPGGRHIVFPVDITTGRVAIQKNGGLLKIDGGYGELYVTVKIDEEYNTATRFMRFWIRHPFISLLLFMMIISLLGKCHL